MVIKQLPIIEEQLQAVKEAIADKLAIVEGLVCTEETYKEVKKIRTEFMKELEQYEEQRKAIKAAIIDPYIRFEDVYNDCIRDQYKVAKETLDKKVNAVVDELNAQKTEKIRIYFNEYAESKHVSEYADFNNQMHKVGLSDTEAALKKECREKIDQLVSGLKAIDAQPEDIRAEILAEFRKTLSATEAMTIVAERRKTIEEQKRRQEEREARQAAEAEAAAKVAAAAPAAPPPLAPPSAASVPAVDNDPVMTVKISVTAKKSELRALKAFLNEGGYKYE